MRAIMIPSVDGVSFSVLLTEAWARVGFSPEPPGSARGRQWLIDMAREMGMEQFATLSFREISDAKGTGLLQPIGLPQCEDRGFRKLPHGLYFLLEGVPNSEVFVMQQRLACFAFMHSQISMHGGV